MERYIDYDNYNVPPNFVCEFGKWDVKNVLSWYYEFEKKLGYDGSSRLQFVLNGDNRLGKDDPMAYHHERCFLDNEQYQVKFFDSWHPNVITGPLPNILSQVPFKVRRILLRKLLPFESIRFHTDPCLFRLHIPLETNAESSLLWSCGPNQSLYKKYAFKVGKFYLIDTFSEHVAFNSSEYHRSHAIGDVEPSQINEAAALWLSSQHEDNITPLLEMLYERSMFLYEKSNNTLQPLDKQKTREILDEQHNRNSG